MYIKLLDKIINLEGIMTSYIDDNRIIIEYSDKAHPTTIDYSEVKFDVNAEKQKIEQDFEKLECSLIVNYDKIINEQKNEILRLGQYESDLTSMKHIINLKLNPFKKIKWLKGLIND